MVIKQNKLFTAVERELWQQKYQKMTFEECIQKVNKVAIRESPGKEKRLIEANVNEEELLSYFKYFKTKYDDLIEKNITPLDKLD